MSVITELLASMGMEIKLKFKAGNLMLFPLEFHSLMKIKLIHNLNNKFYHSNINIQIIYSLR